MVKTIDELRKGFEERFHIKMMIYQLHGKIRFNEHRNRYEETITNQGELTDNEKLGVAWLDGAWFMYQELNK